MTDSGTHSCAHLWGCVCFSSPKGSPQKKKMINQKCLEKKNVIHKKALLRTSLSWRGGPDLPALREMCSEPSPCTALPPGSGRRAGPGPAVQHTHQLSSWKHHPWYRLGENKGEISQGIVVIILLITKSFKTALGQGGSPVVFNSHNGTFVVMLEGMS